MWPIVSCFQAAITSFVKTVADKGVGCFSEVTFLGCVVSEKGTECDPEKSLQFLTTVPILVVSDDEGDLVLDTDASDIAWGPSFNRNKIERYESGYASRTVSHAERRYCTTRRELLAVDYGRSV